VFSNKQEENLYLFFSLKRQVKNKKIKRFHLKNVLLKFYRPSKKYLSGDPIPLKEEQIYDKIRE
jgi:hypothetical protein